MGACNIVVVSKIKKDKWIDVPEEHLKLCYQGQCYYSCLKVHMKKKTNPIEPLHTYFLAEQITSYLHIPAWPCTLNTDVMIKDSMAIKKRGAHYFHNFKPTQRHVGGLAPCPRLVQALRLCSES